MRAHVVESGVIVNTIEVDALEDCPGAVAAVGGEGIGWRLVSGQWHAPALPVADRNSLIADIDRRADALRLAIVGDPVRVEEYRLARDEAKAYISAGYSGSVPPSVMSWAKAKAWSARQAADDIAAVAAAWESALYAVRSIRLQGKESVRNAATDAAAKTAHDSVLAQLAALHP